MGKQAKKRLSSLLVWFKLCVCIRKKHGVRGGREGEGTQNKEKIEKRIGCVCVCRMGWFGGMIHTSLMSCWVLRPRPYQAPVTVMAIDEIVRMDVRMCFRVAILVARWLKMSLRIGGKKQYLTLK